MHIIMLNVKRNAEADLYDRWACGWKTASILVRMARLCFLRLGLEVRRKMHGTRRICLPLLPEAANPFQPCAGLVWLVLSFQPCQ